MGTLDGRKVAVVAADGFEESELKSPLAALEREGATAQVLGPHEGTLRAWSHGDWSGEVRVDRLVTDAVADDYDALLLPGGVMSPDQLRGDPDVVRFAQEFFDAGKPIAAICHGVQLLIETGELDGRRLTSFPSLKTDLVNAGADWVDAEVVEDENLVTSRFPDDLAAFNAKMIEAFREMQAPPDDFETITAPEAPMPASFSPPRRGRQRTAPPPGAPRRPSSGRALARHRRAKRGK